MAMTNEWRQRKALIRSGMFKDELSAWSYFDWKDKDGKRYPWLSKMLNSRSNLVTQWCKQTGRRRSEISPEQLRQSFTYRRLVRQWYADHDWLKGDRKDPYACLRAFQQPWAKSPEGRGYRPPWKIRRDAIQKRRQAIDKRFSRATGLEVI